MDDVRGLKERIARRDYTVGLIGLGYANRVMVSHDSVSTILQRPGDWPPEMAAALAG